MLNAFKEQLKQITVSPDDKFRIHLRKRVGKRATLLLEKRLKRAVLLMPSLVSRIYEIWSHEKTPLESKRVGGFLLAYMYHPKDFLAEDEFGLFGYLDDTYFVLLAYETVLKKMEESGGELSEKDQQFLSELAPVKRVIKSVIPEEAKKIELMNREVDEQVYTTYLDLFNSTASAA